MCYVRLHCSHMWEESVFTTLESWLVFFLIPSLCPTLWRSGSFLNMFIANNNQITRGTFKKRATLLAAAMSQNKNMCRADLVMWVWPQSLRKSQMWWFTACHPCGKMEGGDRGIALLEVHGPVGLKILHSQSKKTPASKRWERTEPLSYFPHTRWWHTLSW